MSIEGVLHRFGHKRPPSAKNRRAEFRRWLQNAEPGQAYKYWVGDLASQRADYVQLNYLASDVWDAYARGLVHLVQRKHGPSHYSYEARRCATL